MKETFSSLATGLTLASLLIYFLMVGLDKSFVVPLTVMSIVPLCLIGILPALYFTGSAVNVQSLLGFIFIVGIKVANSVLMTDYAQELRRHEGSDAVSGHPQSGQRPRAADHHDGPGGLLCLDDVITIDRARGNDFDGDIGNPGAPHRAILFPFGFVR